MTLPRRSWAAVPTLVVAALVLSPTKAQPQSAGGAVPDDERVLGEWRLVPSDDEARQAVNQAVDEAANAMDFFVRGFARSRLRHGTPIHHRLELARRGEDGITVRFEDETYTTALGRTEERRNPAGEVMRVTQRFRPSGQLEQVFATDRGTRSYVYTPLRDGGLRVATRTESPHLPRAMVFSLDYRRVGPQATSSSSE